MGMTVDVTSYQDAFANFDKGLAILNLIKPLEMSTKLRDIFQYSEKYPTWVFFLRDESAYNG